VNWGFFFPSRQETPPGVVILHPRGLILHIQSGKYLLNRTGHSLVTWAQNHREENTDQKTTGYNNPIDFVIVYNGV